MSSEHARRHNKTAASIAGSLHVASRALNQRQRMLLSYFDYGPLTGSEAAHHAGIPLTAGYRMRVTELRRDGFIEAVTDAGDEVLAVGLLGSPQTLCRITEDGIAEVKRILAS